METVNSFLWCMFGWVLNTPLAALGFFSYLAISIIIAALASCDQVIFEISLYAGADPGVILGCCKILQKKIEHRNDVICRKIIDSARYSFDYSRGADLKVQFDSNKNHPGANPLPLPQVTSKLKLDGYGWH